MEENQIYGQFGLFELEKTSRTLSQRTLCMEDNKMIHELQSIVLLTDLDEHGLKAGDIGTVVLVHDDRAGFEVEFITLDGETVAVVTLFADQVRPIAEREIAHVRPLEPA